LYLRFTKAFHLISTLVECSSAAVKSISSLSPVYSSACQLVLSAETFVFLDHHMHAAAVAISKERTERYSSSPSPQCGLFWLHSSAQDFIL